MNQLSVGESQGTWEQGSHRVLRSQAKVWLWIPHICRKNVIHLNKVLVTWIILLVHKRWILIARGGAKLLTGCTYCFTGKYIDFLSQEKYYLWKIYSNDRKFYWIFFLWQEILFLWQRISSSDRKFLPVKGSFFFVETANFLRQEISFCDRKFLPVNWVKNHAPLS